MANLLLSLKRLPKAVPRILKNLQTLQRLHKVASDRRDKYAPIVYHTYEQDKIRTTWHPKANAWVDEKLPMSRQDFAEYNWYKADLQRLLPVTLPFVFGPVFGCLGLASWLNCPTSLPSAFSEKEDINEIKLQYYQDYQDDIRQKIGPMLQYEMKKIYRIGGNQEHIWLYSELVESYKETFYSHLNENLSRDIRRCEHLKFFDKTPAVLLMTNKDPLELTEKLQKQLKSELSEEELKAILIEAYKEQEHHGGISTNHTPALRLPPDQVIFGDTPAEDTVLTTEQAKLEDLGLTGDSVFVPNETRLGMEWWSRECHKEVNQFIGLPWRLTPHPWNNHRLVLWYEQMLQEDALIAREGGIQKLSDLELKVVLLDRACLRCDENITRGDMEARYKEISYLMSKRVSPTVIISWVTGFFRTTYSPEDDLPQPTVLPKFNRTRLDVDLQNKLKPDARGFPLQVVHPALFANAHRTMAAEVMTV